MAYLPPFNGGRINATIGGNSTSAGAGYSYISTGNMLLAGGNNITLSQNGSAITISAPNAAAQSNQTQGYTAGTTNGANTTLTSTGTFDARSVYLNAHGLSAGFSNSSIVLSAHTTYAASNHSHGNPTLNLTNISGTTASASNGLTLSLSAAPAQTNQTMGYTAGTTNGANTTLTSTGTLDARSLYINAHGLSAGFSSSSIVLSAHTTYAASNHSHGNPTLNLTNISGTTASASNGLTLSLSAAPAQTNQTQGYTAGTTNGANTTLTSTGTFDARSVYLNAHGLISAGFSSSSLILSATQSVQTQNLMTVNGTQGAVSISGGNNVTVGNNASTITISAANQTNQTMGYTANTTNAGNTTLTSTGTLDARSLHVIAQGALYAGFSSSSLVLSAATTYAASNHSHGNPTLNLTNLSGTTASASNGLTLSLSAAAPPAGVALYDGANSITSGTASFLDGNGVSFGINGQTITGSVLAQSNQTLGYTANTTNAGNTTLTSTGTLDARSLHVIAQGALYAGFSSSSLVLSAATTYAASNHSHGNPTLNLTNLSGTTASASNGLTLSLSASQSNQAVSAANGSYAFQTLSFSNANGVSFGTSAGSAITASVVAGGGGGVALNGGGTTYTSGTVNFSATGALTITNSTAGGGGQTYQFSAPAQSSLSATGAVSLSTNGSTISIGAPATSSLSATGAVSISVSDSTISIGVPPTTTWNYFNPQDAYPLVVGQHGQGTLHIQPTQMPNVQFDRIALPIAHSNATNSSGSQTVSFWIGMYTRSDSTLSLASSTSASFAITQSGTAGSYSRYGGQRLFTIGSTNTILEDNYYIGIISRTTSGGANASFSQLVASQINSNFSGIFGTASNATNQQTRGLGYYSASTSAMPASIAFTQIRGTDSMALRQPSLYFVSQTF